MMRDISFGHVPRIGEGIQAFPQSGPDPCTSPLGEDSITVAQEVFFIKEVLPN